MLAVFASPAQLRAATGTWTGGGAGTWDTSATNWSGVAGTPWDSTNGNSNTAQFSANGDAATLSGVVFPGTISFNQGATQSAVVNGTSSNRIQYATNNSSKTISVSPGATGTISGDIINFDPTNATQADNTLLVNGGGKLILSGTTRLKSNTDTSTTAFFQVDGGSELNVTGPLFTWAPAANTATRGSATGPYLGSSTSGNILKVTGSGRMVTGNFNIGNSTVGTGSNQVYISALGTVASPTWDVRGNSAQINIFSSNNLLQIDSGAVVVQTSGGGTGKWSVGTLGFGGNQLIVSGAGTTVSRGVNAGMEIGWSGSNVLSSDSNSFTIQNGATFIGGRVEIGSSSGGGNGLGSNNTQLVTGTNAYFRLNGAANTFFEVGKNSGSSTNSFQVGTGGRADIFGSGTTRTIGVGQNAGANSNFVRVSGAGAQLNFLHSGLPLVIGGNVNASTTINSGGNLNHIDVYNGGALYMDNTGNTLATPPTPITGIAYGANPTAATALVLTGTNSSFNLGDGTAIASATLGKTPGIGGGQTALLLDTATSQLNVNNGRLIAGASAPTTLVSGGLINLLGDSYFSNSNGTSTLISTKITGPGKLFKEGTGIIELSNITNDYSGDTQVVGGVLRVDIAQTGGAAGFADASTVYIDTGARINLAFSSSFPDTITDLYLGGVLQPAGTYGRTGSGATFINDTYFGGIGFGTGLLNVTGSVTEAVPEPSTLVLAGLGLVGLGMIAWKRRNRGK